MQAKWILPIAQFTIALFCHVYAPHQYRVQSRNDRAVDNYSYWAQNWPGSAERLAYAVSYPAIVLAYPLRNEVGSVVLYNSSYTLISIMHCDLVFLAGVVLQWFYLGWLLDHRRQPVRRRSPLLARAKIAGLFCGLVFGVAVGAFAWANLSNPLFPERQVAMFGWVWSPILIAVFALQLRRHRHAAQSA
jgi:hypothetical protein